MHIAVIQMSFSSGTFHENFNNLDQIMRTNNITGVDLVVTSELFGIPYFCMQQEKDFFSFARPLDNHYAVNAFSYFAKKHKCYAPVSLFEEYKGSYYNTLVWIDYMGKVCDIYRKSHIPDGPGYQEKFYFRPGNTGFKTWNVYDIGKVGVGICWDQWFPEVSRSLVYQGADLIIYPTAIGSEPRSHFDTSSAWMTAITAQSIFNVVPVCAVNRSGKESDITFYGLSFFSDVLGKNISSLTSDVITQTFTRSINVKENKLLRAEWGFSRDMRKDLYYKYYCLQD